MLIPRKRQFADQKLAFQGAHPFFLHCQFCLMGLVSLNHDLVFIFIMMITRFPSYSGFVNLLHTLASDPGYERSLGKY